MQFNARATPQTVEALHAIADQQGWLVGETLERALAFELIIDSYSLLATPKLRQHVAEGAERHGQIGRERLGPRPSRAGPGGVE